MGSLEIRTQIQSRAMALQFPSAQSGEDAVESESPETVPETLAEIQRHRFFICKRKHEGNTAQPPVQENFFDALKVPKPA